DGAPSAASLRLRWGGYRPGTLPKGRSTAMITTASTGASSDKTVKETVEFAAQSPDVEQPYAELGLKPDEYEQIKQVLGRRPTSAELAMYSVMWSEHCSYKSSKVHLRKFGENVTDQMKENLLVGIGEN